ncbi:hypothetical protein [Desulfococcus sp.]|uniref:hypothetical protein n=1 Tax=Desulfococcus sp. TaxID=2025834 RepID=UPI003593D3D3
MQREAAAGKEGGAVMEIDFDTHAIRIGPHFGVSFQRTLRLPDDGRTYPLPPGLGAFPIYDASLFPGIFSESTGAGLAAAPPARKTFFIPMYQREALWIGFRGAAWHPSAVVVSAGGVNVLTGEIAGAASGSGGKILDDGPQNYIVAPLQPWLDGFNTGDGTIRQFVAMPLGLGYTLEASLTGRERRGGIHITVFEARPGRFPDTPPPEMPHEKRPMAGLGGLGSPRMGLGAGGVMRQRIHPDPHGLDAWDPGTCGEIVIHILNSARFREIAGFDPPPTPIDAAAYTRHGLPWFDLYDEEKGDLPGSATLAGAGTVRARDAALGIENASAPVEISGDQVKRLGRGDAALTEKKES